jgi:hypothetical protein
MSRGADARIAVAARGLEFLVEKVEEPRDDLPVRRRAESDGPRKAFRFGDPVVRDSGRQVQHVSGLEHPFLVRLEPAQDLQVQAGNERVVLLPGDPPAPPPAPLQQEHII